MSERNFIPEIVYSHFFPIAVVRQLGDPHLCVANKLGLEMLDGFSSNFVLFPKVKVYCWGPSSVTSVFLPLFSKVHSGIYILAFATLYLHVG